MVEKPTDAGAGKKPPRTNARPAGTTRKPPPARKPAAKRPTATKSAPAKPAAARSVRDDAVIEPVLETETAQPETVQTQTVYPEAVHDEPIADEPAAESEPSPEPEPTAVAELKPESEPEVAATPRGTLAELAGWVRRVSTVTGARIATLSRRSAASIRESTASAVERVAAARAATTRRVATARAAARERAETARLTHEERVDSRELARLEKTGAEPHLIEASVEFELAPVVDPSEYVLAVTGLTKRFDDRIAVDGLDLRVRPGAFYGIVGPNGAGKTTTLSMITGLLRPDAGSVVVHGMDVWSDTIAAKRTMGVLPDRVRLFDRLTGAQLLYYAGVLRGLDAPTVKRRSADLARAFGLEEGLARLVSDYSAGMTKKIALAAALIHSPRLLVLDEPFESVDPVSAANVTHILKQYVAAGGTVLLSSHSMDLVQRVCDNVAVVVGGVILADGTMDEVREGRSLEERFVELAGGRTSVEGLEWLHTFSD